MESFVGQPVRSLQTMLRIIAQQDAMQPGIIPDGIYGQQTVAAVSAFHAVVACFLWGTARFQHGHLPR